ncbi:DNA gyrase subunit B [hydrothermal vent metagenome]|uniref:DNA gyrase subunit B n=1 Tax=hydrothermal vent metagenome TaxID=652676 RepID=A0A1W1CLH3_9ZZZZ
MQQDYGASNIKVLKGLEAVRKRPGMYIGDTGHRGLHHLVYEVIDNSIDVVNALSSELHMTIYRDGKIHEQDFKQGIPQGPLEVTGTTRKTGTTIEFAADPSIFTETVTFEYDYLAKRFKELAYLNPFITIKFIDERTATKEEYHFEGGIAQYVTDMNKREVVANVYSFSGKADDIEFDIALMYNDNT